MQSVPTRHILHHGRCHRHFSLSTMPHWGILRSTCSTFPIPVSSRQLLQQRGRVTACVVPPRHACTFNRFRKLLGLPLWHILQRQRYRAASAVSSRLLLPSSEGYCAPVVLHRILLPFRRHVQRAAVSNRALLPKQRAGRRGPLSRGALLRTNWPIIARHLFQMPIR